MKLKTEALVLGNFPFGESHKAILLLTPENGILKAVAHGSRKPTSKFGSSMEMLNSVEVILTLSKKSELHSIKEHSLLESRHALRANADSMGYNFYLVEFLKEIFHEAPPNKSVYQLINHFINIQTDGDRYLLHRALVIKILYLLGFIAEFDECSDCGTSENPLFVSRCEGFIFCANCKKTSQDRLLAAGTIQILNKLLHDNIRDISRLKVSAIQKNEIDDTVNTLMKGILGKSLKSESYFYLNSST